MSDVLKEGNSNRKEAQLNAVPRMVAQIIINLHDGGRVTGNMPTDMKITMYMLGEFFKQIGPTLTYSPPSPIVIPPAGIKIPGGQ